MKFKKLAALTAITAAMIGISVPASALPVGLALVIDQSGSISPADWALQKTSYVNVISSSLIKADSSLVIGVWKFDDMVDTVFAPTLISTAAQKSALVSAINAMTQGDGLTAIGDAVTTAFNAFDAFNDPGHVLSLSSQFSKMVIDVSTDGQWNIGSNPVTASNAALAGGVDQVNCLGIGPTTPCNWNPASSLDFAANSQATFQAALAEKIKVETNQAPEPTSLALLGLGLAALTTLRRRQRG